jgi:L-malate glycosyltransferase
MRVCYVAPHLELGGGAKVIFQHAQLLAATGNQVVVVGGGPLPEWAPGGVDYLDYGTGLPDLPEQDLIIATFWTTLAIARRLDAGPVAHFCQGYEGDLEHLRPVLGEIEAVYSEPVPAIAVTPYLADFLHRRFGRESAVVPPALDPRFRPRLRLFPARLPWIAVPGIFEAEVKGVPTALAAIRLLREAGVPCRVLRLSLFPLSQAERELLEPDLFLCRVSPEDAAEALRSCDLLLFPSRSGEGFGLPLLEAMASQVPVVASEIPSTRFIAGASCLVPAGDAAAFAEAAGTLLRQPRLWRQARRRGHRIAQRFRPERVAPLLAEAVRWAGARATGRRP